MKTFYKIITFIIIFLLILYLLLLYGIPQIINNSRFTNKLCEYIKTHTDFEVSLKDFSLESTPALVYIINAGNISVSSSNEKIIDIKHLYLSTDIKLLKVKTLKSDKVTVYADKIKKLPQDKKNTNKKRFNFNNLPENIQIRELLCNSKNFKIETSDLNKINSVISFNLYASTPMLNESLTIKNAQIILKNNNIYINRLAPVFGKTALNVKGSVIKTQPDIYITGKDLPVADLEKTLLYFQKKKESSKKFMENFYDYKGKADVSLTLRNDGLHGNCTIKNLQAKTVLFDVPIIFENVVLNFNKTNAYTKAKGFLGNEPVFLTLDISGLTEREVKGEVSTVLTDKFNYISNLKILNSANVNVKFFIKDKKTKIDYLLNIEKGSDIYYKNIFLGLKNKNRIFKAQTLKDGNNLYLKDYRYFIADVEKEKIVVYGNGLFTKKSDKFTPVFINCKTSGYAPLSVVGSLGKYVQGGNFKGDLKFDFLKEKLYGNFEVANTKFKEFYVKSAKILAGDKIKILGEGFFKKQKFTCELVAKNQFGDDVYVYNLNLFLDKFIIVKSSKKPTLNKFKNVDISSTVRNLNITIEDWKIKVNTIKKDRITLENIALWGKLKENVFDFTMDKFSFAKGSIKANGKYNFNNNSSDINFYAENIDSNIVADLLFNLPDQIQGTANAFLHAETKNILDDIQAKAEFSIDNGYLNAIADKEFLIRQNKVKLQELTNLDLSQNEALAFDIKGAFNIKNNMLENINLTTVQKSLALFIEGDYNIDTGYADINLYGKYDEDMSKGVKIVHIPLNLILNLVMRKENSFSKYSDKLNKIPKTNFKNTKYFRAKAVGNINKEKLKFEIKKIKE